MDATTDSGKSRNYTDEEIKTLHAYLHEILAEIVRVCKKLDIPYFIQGGTAIGAFFENDILPWDDDIDVGMTREHYERFLREAPAELKPGFFLQWVGSDPHTPFYFSKVRMDDTLFVEGIFKRLPIHHGIFVDIFPFDRVPDNQCLQKTQRLAANFLNTCFMGKDIWQWKHCGTCEVEHPSNRGFLPCLATRIVDTLFSKMTIYRMLRRVQSLFNGGKGTYYNMVTQDRDHIAVESIEHPQQVRFGALEVTAPSDLEIYLRHHYPRLRRHIPKEEQVNHKPEIFSFRTKER